jgi:rhamnosyltransferase
MKLHAIIVTYFPRADHLERLVRALEKSHVQVIQVDNTPGPGAQPVDGCRFVPMGDNLGIAAAQNRGVELAMADGAQVILFFDQDSTISAGFVERLIARLDVTRPGVVGPVFHDEAQGFECPCYVLNRWGYPNKMLSMARTEPYDVDVRISSGSAVTAATFPVVGPMDESLFLDYVDVEWCLRARARGVPIQIDPAASMKHSIGETAVQVGPLKVFIDGPTRTYYRVRNALLLLRKREVPIVFALKEIASEIVHHTIQLVIAQQRLARFRATLCGVWHGLAGISGRREQP